MTWARWLATGLLLLGSGAQGGPAADRLYGRVETVGGRVYEGWLRWDRNEAGWTDLLSGTRELPWRNLREAERLDRRDARRRYREHSIHILGLRISWGDDEADEPTTSAAGVRFGHLQALEVLGDDRALLILRSGEEVEFEGGSTDLGEDLRRLVVEDPERGRVTLEWDDLDRVEFLAPPAGVAAPADRRLWGTVRTEEGMEFTGFVAWDADEVLTSDVLDGEERGRHREIPFDRIAAIERAGSHGARVVLRNGEEVRLSGSNDVDDGNRGIVMADPALGQVRVPWDAFVSLELAEAPAGVGSRSEFDGGRPLTGVVRTRDGEELRGRIRWDNDEASTWEILDGRSGALDFDIEFGMVRSLRPLGSWGAEVTLLDGRSLELEDSNDVDEGNRGVFVTLASGETVRVDWWDLDEVVFDAG